MPGPVILELSGLPTPSFLLDGEFEPAFENLTELARKILKVPVALISIVEAERQYFKSHCGLPEPYATLRETPISHSFCQHVVASSGPLIIPDARLHPLMCDNPAIRDLSVIAYLGMPIFIKEGVVCGAFCIIDDQPREWSAQDVELVKTLAAQVTTEVSVRSLAERHRHELSAMQMAEEERIAANLADRHDLRSPLHALMLGLEAVAMLGDLNEDQKEYLAMAEHNAGAVLTMIDQMLDVGLSDRPGSRVLTDSSLLVSRAVNQLVPLARERNQTLSHLAGAVPPLTVDPEKIVRVLVNLIANAIKFTPEGGAIQVGVRESRRPDGLAGVVFSVADDGVGVPPEKALCIFEEGVRLDPTVSPKLSRGLGLSICKRIVEAHGGRIWLENREPAGSVFLFELPV